MKLVIREYLSMLKESGELDVLLPDLLLAMGIQPLSKAQVGVRQYGVDVAAHGIDTNDGLEKLFLLTIKKGDLSRQNWDDGTPQALRSSLNEIMDIYIPTCVSPDHIELPKKIIVCCNGDIKQEVEANWKGYTRNHTKPGTVEFSFWGGDKLSILIETHLLDEYLFPEQFRKYLRKTISLVDQIEEEPTNFYRLIESTLFDNSGITTSTTGKASKSQLKAISVLNLSLNIVFHWSQEADNLRPAYLGAERMLLRIWDWMRINNLLSDSKIIEKYMQVANTYFKVMTTLAHKIEKYCIVEHGLFGYGTAEEIEYPLRAFEIIGLLSSFGIFLLNFQRFPIDEDMRSSLQNALEQVVKSLYALIALNPSASIPLYDTHFIDIALCLILLQRTRQEEKARDWVRKLSINIVHAYEVLGRYFPIHTSSYDDLVALLVGDAPPKTQLTQASTILPLLAEWHSILHMSDEYEDFRKSTMRAFPHTNIMLWIPDESVDDCLYSFRAGYSGVGRTIILHKSLEGIKDRILREKEELRRIYKMLSCVEYNMLCLIGISSRHFRNPVIPYLWEQLQSA